MKTDLPPVAPIAEGFTTDYLKKRHADVRQRMTPEQYSQVYPRRIISPEGYTHHTVLVHHAFSSYFYLKFVAPNTDLRTYPGSPIAISSFCLGDISSRLFHPTWYVGEDLALALLQTTIPDDLCWKDLKWPMKSLNFFFPMTDRFYRAMGDFYLPYVQVGWIEPEDEFDFLGQAIAKESPGPDNATQISSLFGYQDRRNIARHSSVHTRVTLPLAHLELMVKDPNLEEYPETVSQEDRMKHLNRLKHRLICGLIMVMNSSPELVEEHPVPDRLEKRDKKGLLKREALWSPNFIGRHYQLRSEVTKEGAHSSPRTHWRRGHFRHQRHGTGMTLIRLTWIEPCLVNPPDHKAAEVPLTPHAQE